MGRGDCPQELEPSDRSIPVNVNLIRVERDYVPPEKPKYKAFSGTGRILSGALCSTVTHLDCLCEYFPHDQWGLPFRTPVTAVSRSDLCDT